MESAGGSKCFWEFRSLIQRKQVDSVRVGRREGHHQLVRILSVTDLIAIANYSINSLKCNNRFEVMLGTLFVSFSYEHRDDSFKTSFQSGVGATIGAGVYVLVGTVAREYAGPALTITFFIAGKAAALSAFCYAELACRCPSAGSAYHYSYICVGEGVAWLVGWALILEYTVGGAAVARGITPNLAQCIYLVFSCNCHMQLCLY
ncbi:hypothetical protein ACFX2I_013636 [Malus domestica]